MIRIELDVSGNVGLAVDTARQHTWYPLGVHCTHWPEHFTRLRRRLQSEWCRLEDAWKDERHDALKNGREDPLEWWAQWRRDTQVVNS